MNKPAISVIIGTLGRPQVVSRLLDDLLKYSKKIPIEVLVFDQSVNKDYRILSSGFPKRVNFYLFHLHKPNTCRYLNLGWQKSKADIVLYLDDDVRLTKMTLTTHINSYSDKRTKGVAGRVINVGERVSESKEIGIINWKGAVFNKNFSSINETFVDFPYGCNMSFRKTALQEIGGFDEKLKPPIYSFNEIDIGVRMNKKWPNSLIFKPEALVYHDRYPFGGTRTYKEDNVSYSNNFNYGYFLAKNYTLIENILFLIRRAPYQLTSERKGIMPLLWGFLYGKKNRT